MSLPRNAAFNLVGALVPAAAALLTVPVLLAHLGTSSYGVLVLVTSIVGYFALLDINATTGSVKYIAERQAQGDEAGVRRVLGFGLSLYLGIGLFGGALIAVFAQELVSGLFKVPQELQSESIVALRLAGLAFLLGQVQQYLQSVPQSLQRYDITGRLEAVFGTAVSVGSMAAAWAGWGLAGVIAVRLVLSVLNVALLLRAIRRLLPNGLFARPDSHTMREVGGFSAYAYLARVATLSANHTDKLLIGAMVDMRSLAWYSVPFVLVNRVYQVAFRLSQVMLPHASAMAAVGRGADLERDYLDATRYVVFVNASLLTLLVALAPEIMQHWAGADFGPLATHVMLLVTWAIFLDTLTNLPTIVNDGLGHPGVSGLAAVGRAAVGFAAAWIAIGWAGVLGAAVALVSVASLSMLIFVIYVHGRTVPVRLSMVLRCAWVYALPVVALAFSLTLLSSWRPALPLNLKLPLLGLMVVGALGLYGWIVVLRPPHRAWVLHLLNRKLRRQ